MEKTKKNLLLAGIGLASAGVVSYFGWQFLKESKQNQSPPSPPPSPPKGHPAPRKTAQPKPASPAKSAKPALTQFPLKPGSRGGQVKELQQALIARHGKKVLPKQGADGSFGAELTSALKSLALPTTITQTTFDVLTAVLRPNPVALALDIYKRVMSRDFNKVLSELRKIKDTKQYLSVNEAYKKHYMGWYRYGLITGVMRSFTDAVQKEKLGVEFSRMGLKYNQQKDTWSLSGTVSRQLITTKPTWVWRSKTEYVKVPTRMVLGSFVSSQNGYVTFQNNGQHFMIKADAVASL